jgi:AdoMet-dependent heme synthase
MTGPMHPNDYTQSDFARAPLMFYYEVTQACDLVCKHCRASAQEQADPRELTTQESLALIDQVAGFPRRPMIVMTGGDPLKRPDLFDLIRHGAGLGLHVALTPSATPLATREAFQKARDAGVRALGISLDGADAPTHDAFRGWEGSFERTLRMLANARELELPVQVNTTITRRNFHQIDRIAELLSGEGIAMWSVFFLVPVGRGVEEQRISPEEYEIAFERLWRHAQQQPYAVKTTEAPHYRRWVLRQGGHPLAGPKSPDGQHQRMHRAPLGVTDGKGVMFVSHTGEIFPAGFLPLCCGRFPQDSVIDTYQQHPTFLVLRNPDRFKGICGMCEYRYVCGGSRARAYAVTGDPLEAEPDCAYTPGQDPMPEL